MFTFCDSNALKKNYFPNFWGIISLTLVIHPILPHEILVKDPGFSRKVKEAAPLGLATILSAEHEPSCPFLVNF